MILTLFENNKNTKPIGRVQFADFFRKLLSDNDLLKQGDSLASLAASSTDRYHLEKNKLPAFCVGGFSKRNDESCDSFEPYLVLEIDDLDPEGVPTALMALREWEYTFAAFASISRMGLRVLVKSDCTPESREHYIESAAIKLSEKTGVPAGSIDGYPHIDTSTKNISRLWYYTGIPKELFFYNPGSRVFSSAELIELPGRKIPPKGDPPTKNPKYLGLLGDDSGYRYEFSKAEIIEAAVREIEQNRIDLTSTYEEWFSIGRSIASEFGEEGRDFFHRVSQFYSGYTPKECDLKYDDCIKGGGNKFTIGTFLDRAKRAGVTVDFSRLYDELNPGKRKEERFELDLFDEDKIVVSDPDMEKSVAVYVASKNGRYDELILAIPQLKTECFRNEESKTIFNICAKLSSSGKYVDYLTVESSLKTSNLESALSILKENAHAQIDFETAKGYADRVAYLYRRSEIAKIYADTSKKIALSEGDMDGVLRQADAEVGLIERGGAPADDDISSAASEFRKQRMNLFHRLASDINSISGITTGLKCEDKFCAGRMKSHLVIVAARPGMGKTAKVLEEARAVAKSGKPVGIFSLEMSRTEIVKRLVCQEGEIDNEKMKNPTLLDFNIGEDSKVEATEDFISRLPIRISDKDFSLRAIKSKARMWKRLYGIEAIYIDYLNLIQHDSRHANKTIELGEVTRELKLLAKELEIPVIALHQLNRSVEVRGGTKRPQLSDLRDSGRVEEDADVVIFIYRPDYYKILEDESGRSLKGVVELIYAKHRDGSLDTVYCEWIGRCFKFVDSERDFSVETFERRKMDPYDEVFKPTPVLTKRIDNPKEEDIPF